MNNRNTHIKLKVCGMRDANNVAELIRLNPDFIGFIFYGKSPRYVDEGQLAAVIDLVPSSIKKVGIFVNEDVDEVSFKVNQFDLNYVQLHGSEPVAYVKSLKNRGVKIIKTFSIGDGFDFDQLAPYIDWVDYFLFDTKTTLHGGSGKKFDWQQLHRYQLETSFFLSGGITMEDVPSIMALGHEQLYAVDINSRFEIRPGYKDIKSVQSFINQLNSYA